MNRNYLLACEGLACMGGFLCGVGGRWDIAACGWALACYVAINRMEKRNG